MRRGLARDRDEATSLVDSGRVTVGGAPVDKPSRLVAAGEPVVVRGPAPAFVSRAGGKLDGALRTLGLDTANRRVLDAGASTGGFTDCLLQRGAAQVVAVDVGYGLLHERLVGDPRVRNVDRTNIRELDLGAVGAPFDLVTADLSFISLRSVAPILVEAAGDHGELLVLVKPQFEATRAEADRGRGVIRDPAIWRRVLGEVIAAFLSAGASIMAVMVSSVPGPEGNVEFVAHLRGGSPVVGGAGVDGTGADELIEAAVRDASSEAP